MDQSDADVGSGNEKSRTCRQKSIASDSSGSDDEDALNKLPLPPMMNNHIGNCYFDLDY